MSSRAGPVRGRGEFLIGDRVVSGGRRGVVLFFGLVKFATGKYVGIELEQPEGKHDGTMKGERYFECRPNHGVFVKPSMVTLDTDASSSAAAAPPQATATATPEPDQDEQAQAQEQVEPPPATSRRSSIDASSSSSSSTIVDSSFASAPVASPVIASSQADPTGTPRKTLAQALENKQALRDAVGSPSTSPPLSSTPAKAVVASFSLPPLDSVVKSTGVTNTGVPVTAIALNIPPADKPTAGVRSAEYDSLVASHTKLSQEFSALQSKLQTVESDNHRLEQELLKASSALSTRDRQLAEVRTELSESTSGNAQIESLQNMVEMLTLDKALAEEGQEGAQAELDIMKNQYANMELELNLLREQHAALQHQQAAMVAQHQASANTALITADTGVDSQATAKVLEQNALLSDALRKLRDLNLADKQSFTSKIHDLERTLDTLNHAEADNVNLRAALATSQQNEHDLKDQLDAALELEKMVETLSQTKLDLEEQCKAAQRSTAYLQSLVDASEEVEEGYKELQVQLQQELDQKEYSLSDLTQRYKLKTEQIEDAQMTLRKFRDLTRTLEQENQDLKAKLDDGITLGGAQAASLSIDAAGSHAPLGSSLAATRASTLLASRLKQVRVAYLDQQLMQVERELAEKKTQFAMLYIPSNITLDDRSLTFLQLLDRLKSKARVLGVVCSKFYGGLADTADRGSKVSVDLASGTAGAEQSLLAWKACLLLANIVHAIENITQALWALDVDAYNSLCIRSHVELTPLETILDSYLNMISLDTLNELTSLQSLVQANWILYSFLVEKVPMHALITTGDANEEDQHVMPYRMCMWPIPAEERDKWNQLADSWHRRAREATRPSSDSSLTPSLPSLSTFSLTLTYSTSLAQCLSSSVADVLDSITLALKKGRAKKKRESGIATKETNEPTNAALEEDATSEEEDITLYQRLWSEIADACLNNLTLATQLSQTAVRNYNNALSGPGLSTDDSRRAHGAALRGLATHLRSLDSLSHLVVDRLAQLVRDIRPFGQSDALAEMAESVSIETEPEGATTHAGRNQLEAILRACKAKQTTDEQEKSLLVLLTEMRTELFTSSKRVIELTELASAGIGQDARSHESTHASASLKSLHMRSTSFLLDAADVTATSVGPESSPPSTIQPWFHHPLTIRAQLSSTAAMRQSMQDLSQKLADKSRELFQARSAISEEHAKQDVLKQQLQSHLSKANAQVELANMVENQKIQLDEAGKQITLAKNEVDKLARENRAVRKQMLKLKSQYLKEEQTRAATSVGGVASTAVTPAGSTGVASSAPSTSSLSSLASLPSGSLTEVLSEVDLLRRTLTAQREEIAACKAKEMIKQINEQLPQLQIEPTPQVRRVAHTVAFKMPQSIALNSVPRLAAAQPNSLTASLPPSLPPAVPATAEFGAEVRFLRSKLTEVAKIVWHQRVTPRIVKVAQPTQREAEEQKSKEAADVDASTNKKLLTPYQQYIQHRVHAVQVQQCCDKLNQRVNFIADQQKLQQWTSHM